MRKLYKFLIIVLIFVPIDGQIYLNNAAVGKLPGPNPVHLRYKRLVGGTETDIESYQFMAAIVVRQKKDYTLHCGCTIIAAKWIITSAKCVQTLQEKVDDSNMYISSGNTNWKKGRKHNVLNVVPHEDYENEVMDNDIALIRVKQNFNSKNTEQPIQVASQYYSYNYKHNTHAKVLGWGLRNLSDDDSAVQLHLEELDVHIFNHTYCLELYGADDLPVTDTMVCAGNRVDEKDACRFDSGGPLLHDNLLIGILSWGTECGNKDRPTVYTKISLYQDWILKMSRKFKDPISEDIFEPKSPSVKTSDMSDIAPPRNSTGTCIVGFKLFVLVCTSFNDELGLFWGILKTCISMVGYFEHWYQRQK